MSRQTSQQAGQLAEGGSGGNPNQAGNPNQGAGQGAGQGLLRRLRFDAASGFEYDAKGMQAAPGPLTLTLTLTLALALTLTLTPTLPLPVPPTPYPCSPACHSSLPLTQP